MSEIELTLMSDSINPTTAMLDLVGDFSKNEIYLHTTQWNTASSELLRQALARKTSDISEIGSTWINNFASMQALRPFTTDEIHSFGGADSFVAEAWQSGLLDNQLVYGIPWTLDVRTIYYRRDLFAQAGIEEETAFQNIPTMQANWRKLQAIGVARPWSLSIGNSLSTLHYLASWVWEHGGNFISADGKQPRFHEPAAKEAIYQYFMDQYEFFGKEQVYQNDFALAQAFAAGEIASTFSGYWLYDMLLNNPKPHAEVLENLGIGKFPMPAFIGGSHLVIWNTAPNVKAALELMAYLCSQDIHIKLPSISQIPARLDALAAVFPIQNPNSKAIIESLQTGKTFKAPYLWGMVESRLLPIIVGTWEELLENPSGDIKTGLFKRLDILARRLEMALAAN